MLVAAAHLARGLGQVGLAFAGGALVGKGEKKPVTYGVHAGLVYAYMQYVHPVTHKIFFNRANRGISALLSGAVGIAASYGYIQYAIQEANTSPWLINRLVEENKSQPFTKSDAVGLTILPSLASDLVEGACSALALALTLCSVAVVAELMAFSVFMVMVFCAGMLERCAGA